MKVVLRTKVKGNYRTVMAGFDKELFLALAPPFPPIKLEKFTGSEKGDEVHIRFKAPVNSMWISDITDHGFNESEAYFIDKGRVLPWPLKSWTHRHIVRKVKDQESEIIDDIEYDSGIGFLNILLYPALYLGFLPRKRIYKRYFSS